MVPLASSFGSSPWALIEGDDEEEEMDYFPLVLIIASVALSFFTTKD